MKGKIMKLNIKNSLRALLFVPVMAFAVSAAVAPMTHANTVRSGAEAATTGTGIENASVGDEDALVLAVTNALLFIIGAISVIMIIVGGIRYVISNGVADKITGAKNTILYAVIGLAIALLAYAIVNFVLNKIIAT